MITVGKKYIFKKSGNEVIVLGHSVINFNGKLLKGYTVERTSCGKQMFVPADSLILQENLV